VTWKRSKLKGYAGSKPVISEALGSVSRGLSIAQAGPGCTARHSFVSHLVTLPNHFSPVTVASMQDERSAPTIRFKRRKTTHAKRIQVDEDGAVSASSNAPAAATAVDAHTLLEEVDDEDESVLKLKEILRNRRRPRDRVKEVARKPEPPKTELVPFETPPQHSYTSRFVAQTGQVVDRDDKQM
jgi:hypothetical protein